MPLEIQNLPPDTRQWLDEKARSRGTSIDIEALSLLDDDVHDRQRREKLFRLAAQARVRVAGPPPTEAEIDQAINWGRNTYPGS